MANPVIPHSVIPHFLGGWWSSILYGPPWRTWMNFWLLKFIAVWNTVQLLLTLLRQYHWWIQKQTEGTNISKWAAQWLTTILLAIQVVVWPLIDKDEFCWKSIEPYISLNLYLSCGHWLCFMRGGRCPFNKPIELQGRKVTTEQLPDTKNPSLDMWIFTGPRGLKKQKGSGILIKDYTDR